jgi:RHS repeat-associated protein
MVEFNAGGSYTQFAYSPTGGKLAVMNGQTVVKAFVGPAVYAGTSLAYYRHVDWLGSSRFASTPTTRTMYSSTAYAPYGEPYAQAGTADLSFTGQNSDTAGGLYDFLYREYSTQGRWPSPDPAGTTAAEAADPQTWNRYAYVRNSPTQLADPFGTCTIIVAGLKDKNTPDSPFNKLANEVGGIAVFPYENEGLVAGLFDVQGQAFVPSDSSGQLATLINQYADDPNGIQVVTWSGGASTTAGAIDSGAVSQDALQNITSITYLSPGFGFGPLALDSVTPPRGTASFAHGSGWKDFAATFSARLTGKVGASEYKGHSFGNAVNSRFFKGVRPTLTACPPKTKPGGKPGGTGNGPPSGLLFFLANATESGNWVPMWTLFIVGIRGVRFVN